MSRSLKDYCAELKDFILFEYQSKSNFRLRNSLHFVFTIRLEESEVRHLVYRVIDCDTLFVCEIRGFALFPRELLEFCNLRLLTLVAPPVVPVAVEWNTTYPVLSVLNPLVGCKNGFKNKYLKKKKNLRKYPRRISTCWEFQMKLI